MKKLVILIVLFFVAFLIVERVYDKSEQLVVPSGQIETQIDSGDFDPHDLDSSGNLLRRE